MELTTFGFEASYRVERLESRQVDAVHYFVRPRRTASKTGLHLETRAESLSFAVTPHTGKPWVGTFEGGPGGITGLFATPSAETLCVAVKGQGFWIPVGAPATYQVIPAIPIKEVLVIPQRAILAFVDNTRIAAYGANGLIWLTPDLSWDGLRITSVSADGIRGVASDSPAGREVPFSVDATTGASQGGSSPASYGAR